MTSRNVSNLFEFKFLYILLYRDAIFMIVILINVPFSQRRFLIFNNVIFIHLLLTFLFVCVDIRQ